MYVSGKTEVKHRSSTTLLQIMPISTQDIYIYIHNFEGKKKNIN